MGQKIFIVGVTICIAAAAFPLPSPFLIAGAVVAIIGAIAVVLDK